jgi:NAD(P)-dependent dehydrogenase (short-subunit alcohol dehydrogenase family)
MQTTQVAVITGAASGMGKTAAIRWAQQGWHVAAVDRAAAALKELEGDHSGITAVECDVTDEGAVAFAAEEITSVLGEIDRLVNAAGICVAGKIGELAASEFRRVMTVNYFGTVHWVNAVLPAMRARRRGEIVNFASVAGFIPTPNLSAYGSSKFAVLGYTEALAEETRSDGVRVLCVCPPGVDTPLYTDLMAGTSLGPRIQKFVKPITPDSVIDALERALPGTRTYVFPGRGTTAMHRMRRFAPTLTNRLFRSIYGL